MPHTTWAYSVTFEYDSEQSQTSRGTITVPNIALGVRRAVESARKEYRGARPRSLVVVLDSQLPTKIPRKTTRK
jgi:hypothetical protein